MPRFFFDIHDDVTTFDDEGTELPDLEAAIAVSISTLPRIAADEIPASCNDRRHFVVLVTDQDHRPVYSATLTFTGVRLMR